MQPVEYVTKAVCVMESEADLIEMLVTLYFIVHS